MRLNLINVKSEISPLKTVVLHRPGKELENLIPDDLNELLFDDIPFLEDAQSEHDAFTKLLEDVGVEVLFLDQLVAEAIDARNVREQFIKEWLSEASVNNKVNEDQIISILMNITDTKQMVNKTMEGFRRSEISISNRNEIPTYFIVNPMPNLYFTRDPFASLGNGIVVSRMFSETRRRETIYGDYIFRYHPRFVSDDLPKYYSRNEKASIEGGDILVLSEEVLAIGLSQRTELASVRTLAKELFSKSSFRKIILFEISDKRQFMHLDTVFTMVDVNKFVIHPEIEENLKLYLLEYSAESELKRLDESKLEDILEELLNVSNISLIRAGGNDEIAAMREQWNDGANMLAIAPGEVVVYHRNVVTNQKLVEAGIKLHILKCSELVRGRGGPRCMSMPLWRN